MRESKQEDITPEANWFESAFDELYPVLYAHRTVEAALPEAMFARDALKLTRADHVLDLCCGAGRHMTHIREWTGPLTGLDYSPALLSLARARLGSGSRLVRADMRRIPFQNAFDAAVNFFTSFGYFEDKADNLAVALGLAAALRPGGRFFIDYVNAAHVEANLVPRSDRNAGEYEVREERWIDPARHRVNKSTLVSREGIVMRRLSESVQLYSTGEFMELLAEGGLRVEVVYGDYDGRSCDASAPRMIAVGRRA